MDYRKLTAVARGDLKADVVIKDARIPNVFSGELERGDVAVADGRIVGLGEYRGDSEVDADGAFLLPGFIEGHCHIESTLLTPEGFAELVLPHGTTTVFADPHEIANTSSLGGLRYMHTASRGLPVDIYLNAPSCVPASPFETPREPLHAGQLATLLNDGTCYALGEMMNYPGVIGGDDDVWAKIEHAVAHGVPCNGHAPTLTGTALNAYLLSRCNSDHECSTPDEALEKLRRGCWVMLRQGATEHNLAALAPLITADERRASRCMLVSDDLSARVLRDQGHLDRLLRLAVSCGISPVSALRMVTLNVAEFNRRYDIGAIAPGYLADMVLVDNLRDFNVLTVWKRGERVNVPSGGFPRTAHGVPVSTVVHELTAADLATPASGTLRAIAVIPGEVVTGEAIVNAADAPSAAHDIAKMAVVNRNTAQRRVGLGFVKGMGLTAGALGSSVAHDAHNFSLVGMDDRSLLTAYNAIKRDGGLVVARGNDVLCHLPLPIAGLMSDLPADELLRRFDALLAASHQLQSRFDNPFMVLSFLSLSVIPTLKLTDQGYVNLGRGGLQPLRL